MLKRMAKISSCSNGINGGAKILNYSVGPVLRTPLHLSAVAVGPLQPKVNVSNLGMENGVVHMTHTEYKEMRMDISLGR